MHTVVFLHRFPESVPDDQLPFKVLASKQTKNHKTLSEQFPNIRWVFPFAKTGARPYGNLSAADKVAVGLAPSSVPYITQILLQEAKLVGGLDKVIFGGQGETAVAAHDAMSSFPEWRPSAQSSATDAAHFLQKTFYTPAWTDIAADPRLAGFVGMHAEDREPTRDISNYSIAKKTANSPPRINTSIVVNTPHCFIHGGYRVTTATWDGRRIDDFAKFLANDVGVHREVEAVVVAPGDDLLTPRDRDKTLEKPKDDGLNDVQKYALELAKDKKENEALVEKIRRRIEADKVERKFRQAREREARAARELRTRQAAEAREPDKSESGDAAGNNVVASPSPGLEQVSGSPSANRHLEDQVRGDKEDGNEEETAHGSGMHEEGIIHDDDDLSEDEYGYHRRERADRVKRMKQVPGRRVGGDETWTAPARGQMSEAQMRAFGLLKETEEEMEVKTEVDPEVKLEGSMPAGTSNL